jgi:hypothetical protein
LLVIHDYDAGRYVPVVAQELIGYQHSGIRGFLAHVATVATFATPLGAARTAIGKAAILILERVLPAIFLLIDENRLNLVKWFPKWGPRMIYFADIAKVGVGVYGLGRFAFSGYKFFSNWKEIRQARAALEGGKAAPDAEKAALALEKAADDIFSEVEKLQAAESSAGKAAQAVEEGVGAAPKSGAGAPPKAGAAGGATSVPGPLAGATEAEIESAIDAATSPGVTGKSQPRIEGKRIPTRQPSRLDIDAIPLSAGETAAAGLARLRGVIGRKISDISVVRDAWERARAFVLRNRTLDASNYEDLYNATRSRFWQEIRSDPVAQRYFTDRGFAFGQGNTTAPILSGVRPDIPVEDIRISLDHVKEKALPGNWKFALDADNLEMTFQNPNAYRQIVQMRHPELQP